jgi:hypothetical protein
VDCTLCRALVARRVDEYGLLLTSVENSENSVPRRVRLRARDADLLSNERIQQCGLADIRSSDDRYFPEFFDL